MATAILAEASSRGVTVEGARDLLAIGGEGVTGRIEGLDHFLGSPKAAAAQSSLPAGLAERIDALNQEGKTVAVLIAGRDVRGPDRDARRAACGRRGGSRGLRRAGVSIIMLTGDNHRTAEAIGRRLGIEVRAELMPQDKQRIVKALQAAGGIVAKVGDGINDAPALAAADVGIAMGGGTDVALETADAAALHGRVGDIAAMIELSRRTMRNIHQNITIALGLKVVFLSPPSPA